MILACDHNSAESWQFIADLQIKIAFVDQPKLGATHVGAWRKQTIAISLSNTIWMVCNAGSSLDIEYGLPTSSGITYDLRQSALVM